MRLVSKNKPARAALGRPLFSFVGKRVGLNHVIARNEAILFIQGE